MRNFVNTTASSQAEPHDDFAATEWSVVRAAGQSCEHEARQALETLCQMYWQPLYAYVRRRGYNVEEAQDLTQGFFTSILTRNSLRGVEQQRGKFRAFLLGAMKHYLAEEWNRAHAHKRGGTAAVTSLDFEKAESRYRIEPVDKMTPERIYERRWAGELLNRAVAQLEREFYNSPDAKLFRAIKPLLLGERLQDNYSRIAQELGLSEGALKVAIHRMRKRYRHLVRQEVARTVSRPEEIDEEIRYLLEVLGS